MNISLKNKWVVATAVLLILVVVFAVIKLNTNSKNTTAPSITAKNSLTPVPFTSTPSPTQTPKSTIYTQTQTTKNTPSTTGATSGKITCNYTIPAAPSRPGTAVIDVSWNNLVQGSTSTKVAVCLFVSGTNQVMFLDTKASGSTTIKAPWIAMNADYTFTLYDDHGGDLPECSGVVLSSCRLDSNTSSGPKPSPTIH